MNNMIYGITDKPKKYANGSYMLYNKFWQYSWRQF